MSAVAEVNEVLAEVHGQSSDRKYSVGEVKDLVYKLIAVIDGPENVEVEFQYGHHVFSVFGDDLGIKATNRKPDNWLKSMGAVFKRAGAGEWLLHKGPVTFELDPRPWLRPGGDPLTHPEYNRSEVRLEDYTFKPRGGYQDDLRAYA